MSCQIRWMNCKVNGLNKKIGSLITNKPILKILFQTVPNLLSQNLNLGNHN